MTSLYVDTSNNLTIGLLSKDFQFIAVNEIVTKKSSEIIHDEIKRILDTNQFKVKDLESLFIFSGPGSYTGIRVGEGLAQVFELSGKKIYSFNVFRISEYLNDIADISDLTWIFPAFKGEVFLRGTNKSDFELVKESELTDLDGGSLLTHGDNKYSTVCNKNSYELIKKYSMDLFSQVKQNNLRDLPFYYRSIEQEFKKASAAKQ